MRLHRVLSRRVPDFRPRGFLREIIRSSFVAWLRADLLGCADRSVLADEFAIFAMRDAAFFTGAGCVPGAHAG